MIYFNCDYNEGAHPKVLEKLCETNMEQTQGYSEDLYCEKARSVIRSLCGDQSLDVHFLTGGTQTNLTVIAASLRPHQGVICAESGHINVHETGAIEACGHKVLTLPSIDGKIYAEQVDEVAMAHENEEAFEHVVQPKMVYISNPTEMGTLYSQQELKELSETCKKHGLYLFLDGARLGYGLVAKGNDLDLESISKLCDVFYIGGTKVGILFGEAVVITNPALQQDFRYIMKQKGAMLAKGRLLGIQFLAVLEDGLYFEIAEHADCMADKIRNACRKSGYPMLAESTTNQIFVILPDKKLEELKEKYVFSYYKRIDDSHSAVRFCTSWATQEADVKELSKDLQCQAN